MKKNSRILFAVAALFAFACTTDTTEELGVQIGGEQTTLTLSLEESRTQLGAEVDGLYPVTWSENDVISVNGVASKAISIGSDRSSATFTFDSALNYPYAVAYPAAANGKVVFADQQTHTEGTFASGVATMYGYATESGAISLLHLTGVLKIGVTGDKTLLYAQISTVDRTPIAGEFDLDFVNGVATPATTSTSLIGYSFGDGLVLGTAAKYLHIAVPAGEYNELYVTFYDTEGGVMYATVKADDAKPLAAGKVREFSNVIAYAPNDDVFVIRDKDTLKAFAAKAATLEKDAIVVADIDMTGEEWTPIGNFAGSFLGNGYAIKGLKAPLFGISNVKAIKGVHLQDVDIVITTNPDAGALICDITNGEAEISHCSATGTMTININKIAANHSYNYYGALIGYSATGKVLHDLYTDVDIVVASTSVSKGHLYLSHLAGRGGAAEGAYISVRDAVCHGTITHNGSSGTGNLYIGGLVTAGACRLTNCVIGKANSDGTSGSIFVGPTQAKASYIGGLSTFINTFTTLENCHNYGNITVSSSAGTINVGGAVHLTRGGTMIDCSTHGKITITSKKDTATYYAGGLVASDDGGSANHVNTFTRCNNYGDIEFTNNVEAKYYNVGGLLGRREVKNNTLIFDNCNNYGDITIKGKIINSSHIGGLIGIIGITNAAPKEMTIKNCANYGDVTIESVLNLVEDGTLRVGGVVGTAVFPMQDVEGYIRNEGNVTCSFDNGSVASAGLLVVGGFVGFTADNTGLLNMSNLKIENKGDVTVRFVNGTNFTYPTKGGIGGLAGLLGTPGAISNALCDCNITAIGLTGRVGFVTGGAYSDTSKATNCQVRGVISVEEKDSEDADGNSIKEPVLVTLGESNYFDYLYRDPIEKSVAEADGCVMAANE